MEKTKTVEDKRLLTVTTSVLVALLLVSQLSLTSSNTRFVPDSNYGSLETNDPDSDNNLLSSTPDFVSASIEHDIIVDSQNVQDILSPLYLENQTTSYSIRAPPFFI